MVSGGVVRRHAFGPWIVIDDPGRADRDQTADDRDRRLRPHRPLREAEPRPPLPPGVEAEQDRRANQRAKSPTRHGADGAERAAADQREAVVERRDGLTSRHPPRGAAPEQLAAEGDDEGRNAEIGDEGAVQRADRAADDEAEDDGEDPDRGAVDAEILGQDVDLRHADDRRDEAEDRADRKIDMAHDDDQHHAGRHHRDRGCLDRQIPQISRGQEQALAIDDHGEKVKSDPDQQQRADHSQHAGVDLGRPQQLADRRLVRRCGRARRRRGHASSRSLFSIGAASHIAGALSH